MRTRLGTAILAATLVVLFLAILPISGDALADGLKNVVSKLYLPTAQSASTNPGLPTARQLFYNLTRPEEETNRWVKVDGKWQWARTYWLWDPTSNELVWTGCIMPSAHNTPYMMGHWVEKDPVTGIRYFHPVGGAPWQELVEIPRDQPPGTPTVTPPNTPTGTNTATFTPGSPPTYTVGPPPGASATLTPTCPITPGTPCPTCPPPPPGTTVVPPPPATTEPPPGSSTPTNTATKTEPPPATTEAPSPTPTPSPTGTPTREFTTCPAAQDTWWQYEAGTEPVRIGIPEGDPRAQDVCVFNYDRNADNRVVVGEVCPKGYICTGNRRGEKELWVYDARFGKLPMAPFTAATFRRIFDEKGGRHYAASNRLANPCGVAQNDWDYIVSQSQDRLWGLCMKFVNFTCSLPGVRLCP